MQLEKLKRKVVKEFTRSPAKTTILLALCPLALYFIVPLFWRGKQDKVGSSPAAPVVAVPDVVAAPVAAVAASTPAVPQQRWEDLVAWRRSDARTRPAVLPAETRSPFQLDPNQITSDEQQDDETQPKRHPAKISQQDFERLVNERGLHLTGTIVGRRTRMATIAGELYREGELVPRRKRSQESQDDQDDAPQLQFQLVEIGHSYAILRSGETEHRLEVKPITPSADGISILRQSEQADDR